jgi:ApaG protein
MQAMWRSSVALNIIDGMSEWKDQPLHGSTSEAVTNNVRVEVESQYAPEHSQPFQSQWFFHYTVRITNEGPETVQLLSRHWVITDATGHVDEVKGPGVVGEQPVLTPGEAFQYTSGCPLRTANGVMRGTYQMVAEDGRRFEVEIAPFALHEPYTVH